MNGNPWLIAPVVALAAFMEVLDISIANVALQHIAGDLSAGQEESTWVLTSYLVTNAIVLPVSGWLSSVMGRKRFFLGCIVGFAVSSLLCGMAPSLPLLILARTIQGLTGGGLQPSSQAILADAFPPENRGMAFALYGMSVVFAPAIGPTLGGWITDTVSWRWVFLINVPVGIVLVMLVNAMVEDPPHAVAEREERRRRGLTIDYWGFALLAVGIGCLQIMLDKGEQLDWFASGGIVALGVVSLVSLAVFVIWELGQDDPIVDLRLLGQRNFGLANLLMFMLGVVLLGSTVLLPMLVQQVFGYTATLAGMVLTPGGFAILCVMPLIGRMVTRVDPRWMVFCGMLLSAAALWHMAGFSPNSDYPTFMRARIFQALGLSLLFIPINTLSFVGMPREKSNQASALINLSRNLGGSVGISIAVTLVSRFGQEHQTVLAAHASPANPVWRHMVADLADTFQRHGAAAAEATHHAQGVLYALLARQAKLLAFLDDFHLLALLFLVMAPLVFLMRRPPAHH